MAEKIRLQKYLSERGVASRRKSEEMMNDGRVKINGRPAKPGDKVDPDKDTVTVDGEKVGRTREKKIYLVLNKPRGYVSTMSDQFGRKCVKDLLTDVNERLYPVGRLDMDSEGLLIFTNDGDFANLMMHPSHEIPKTYLVTVSPRASKEQMDKLESGVEIEDGYVTKHAEVYIMDEISTYNPSGGGTSDKDERAGRTVLRITIHEGRNRQIRKMCEKVGLDVLRLKRIEEGSININGVRPGKYRYLKYSEVRSLKSLAKTSAPSDRKKQESKNN
jgi:23S rRNA pseudouridine2605 synthase